MIHDSKLLTACMAALALILSVPRENAAQQNSAPDAAVSPAGQRTAETATPGKSACHKNPQDILADYGRIQGGSNLRGFSSQESKQVESLLASYTACLALGSGDSRPCHALSPIAPSWEKDPSATPPGRCLFLYMSVANLPGRSPDVAACREIQAITELSMMPQDQFCELTKDMRGICPAFAPSFSAAERKECPNTFLPSRESDCGDKYCKMRFGLYSAAKSRDPKGLSPALKPLYEAYIQKSVQPCSTLTANLSAVYCGVLATAMKRTGGALGMSDAEVQSKKVHDKMAEEINARIKKARSGAEQKNSQP